MDGVGTKAAEEEPLDLHGLSEALHELQKHVDQTAEAFDPARYEGSFRECEADLAERTRRVWEDFWKNCGPYRDAIDKVRHRIWTWPSDSEKIAEYLREHLKEARSALTSSFRSTILQIGDGMRGRQSGENADLGKKVEQARREVAKLRAAVTGDQNGSIPAASLAKAFWVGGVAGVIYGLVEIMAGTDFFREVGSMMGAVGAMALLVVLVSFLAVAIGVAGKRWLYWRRAFRTFKKKCPDKVLPGTDIAVDLYELPPEYPMVFVITFIALLLGSGGLAWWRIHLAEKNDLLRNTAAIVWIVFAAQWLLALVEFIISPGYERERRDELEALEANLRNLSAASNRQEAGAHPALGLPPAAEDAVKDYEKSVKELRQCRSDAVDEARKIRDRYLLKCKERSAALEDVLVRTYLDLLSNFVNSIRRACLDASVDPLFFHQIDQLDIVHMCAADDKITSTAVSTFSPTAEFPESEVISDFERTYRNMWVEIRNEVDQAAIQRAQFDLQESLVPPTYVGPEEIRRDTNGNEVAHTPQKPEKKPDSLPKVK